MSYTELEKTILTHFADVAALATRTPPLKVSSVARSMSEESNLEKGMTTAKSFDVLSIRWLWRHANTTSETLLHRYIGYLSLHICTSWHVCSSSTCVHVGVCLICFAVLAGARVRRARRTTRGSSGCRAGPGMWAP